MTILAVTGALMSFACSGYDFLCPLWIVEDLHYAKSQWAQMRSLRFAGVTIGVIFLGALSDRFGQRRIAAWCLFGMAAILLLLGCGWSQGIWYTMPFYGAFASTMFVNLNALTQIVSAQRQGLANTIYRGVNAATAVLAPFAVTFLRGAWHGYLWVLLTLALLFVISGLVLLLHPNDVAPRALAPLRRELAQLWSGYRVALRQRALVRYIHISQIWGNVMIGVSTFAALRFLELGRSAPEIGVIGTAAGVMALAATIAIGFILDRVSLRRVHIVIGIASGLASLLMGLGNNLWLTIFAYILFVALTNMLLSPISMWVSRAAGESTLTAAFSLHKVLAAFYVTAATMLAGYLEQWVGMRMVFFTGGALGIALACCYLLLPEPPAMRPAPTAPPA